jgi:hypothetical protein
VRSAYYMGLCCLMSATPVTLLAASGAATVNATSAVSADPLLAELSSAFSGGNLVHQVQLTANASWHLGNAEDTGTASLSAATSGASQLTLSLSTGSRTETASGQGTNLACAWASGDGISHDADLTNCWRPVLWFLPALSLQPSLLPSYLGASDMGSGTVGFGAETYRHLQSAFVFPDLSSGLTAVVMQRSVADIGLDPKSFLPTVLTFSIRPDNGAPSPIAVEIHYANYQLINGVKIPFTIQRYINGSLQLEITVTSAQVS